MTTPDIRVTYEDLRKRIKHLQESTTSSGQQTAIMFCDLAKSTAYKSQRDQVVSLIKTYRHNAEVQESVKKLSGQVVKSLGDGILATFKVEDPEDIALPLNAAIRIQKQFERLNRDIVEEERILSRIGVSCGVVVDFAALNPDGERVLDPQGSPVDLAARLCSLAKPGQILIDTRTATLLSGLSGRFDLSPFAERSLKGFADKVTVQALRWSEHADLDLADPDPVYHSSGFLTSDFVLAKVSDTRKLARVVGHSHRHFCDNIELYNIVASKAAKTPEFLFELIFLDPFSPFKAYSELITRRRVSDLKPSIIQNIGAACRLFEDLGHSVKITCAQYPMAIPLLQADDTIYCGLPFKSITLEDGRREGVVDGPYFEADKNSQFGRRVLRHFDTDTRIEIPIAETAKGLIDIENFLKDASIVRPQ
jgi:class 3 adenylate cyclase